MRERIRDLGVVRSLWNTYYTQSGRPISGALRGYRVVDGVRECQIAVGRGDGGLPERELRSTVLDIRVAE